MSDRAPKLIEITIEPKSKADMARLMAALDVIASEDAALGVSSDRESGQIIVKGMSEGHLDRAFDRLLREFVVDVSVGAPQIAYRETLSRAADIDHTYARTFGQQTVGGVQINNGSPGGGQFARVRILFEPLSRGSGYIFSNADVAGSVPGEFIPGVEKGLDASRENGILAGYPLIDFRATLLDGAYHELDSNILTFEIAARSAFRKLESHNVVVLLEPIMRLETATPDEFLGGVIGDINSRRGQIRSVEIRDAMQMIVADAPLAGLFGFERKLAALTRDSASTTMTFSHYAEVPRSLTDGDPPRFPPAMGMRA
jgi:elongation factor G